NQSINQSILQSFLKSQTLFGNVPGIFHFKMLRCPVPWPSYWCYNGYCYYPPPPHQYFPPWPCYHREPVDPTRTLHNILSPASVKHFAQVFLNPPRDVLQNMSYVSPQLWQSPESDER